MAVDALFAAAREAGLAVGPAASARASALPVSAGSAQDRARLARAETVVSTGEAGRTFMPAERDVTGRPRRRVLLVVTLAMAGIVGGAAAVVLVAQSHAPAKVTGDLETTAHPPASASTAVLVPLPPPSAAVSEDVAVTVESNVAASSVWLGGKRIGDAPGPLMLARGGDPVTLTVKADGYASSSVDVVPTKDVVVAVRLAKVAATPGGSVRRVSKDLENPF
jgi:hypothetical protein